MLEHIIRLQLEGDAQKATEFIDKWCVWTDELEYASKILKSEWKLYVIDYLWDIPDLEKILENTKLKEFYKENKWSFACCFDKKWLSKFLENELK